MRPFILRQLRRVQGAQVKELIERGLGDRQVEAFDQRLAESGDIESAIDFNYFPQVFRENWRAAFAQHFKDDLTVQSTLWVINKARNQVAHPGKQDIDAEYTRARLYDIADLLGRINAPDERSQVEAIRDARSADVVSTVPSARVPSNEVCQVPSTKTGERRDNPQRLNNIRIYKL